MKRSRVPAPCAEPGCPTLVLGGGRCPTHRYRNGSTRRWRQTRQRILNRDGYTCQLCGKPATHVDHITPLVDGGPDIDDNLRALCSGCNLTKGPR